MCRCVWSRKHIPRERGGRPRPTRGLSRQDKKNVDNVFLTYLLTPWRKVLLEKLTGSATSQEIPRIFGTRRFLTVPTSARHMSLSWGNSIQSPQLPPTSWRSILILSSHLRLVDNVLLCVIYQLNFTVFRHVTRISRYVYRSVLSADSRNGGRSWNVLTADTAVRLQSLFVVFLRHLKTNRWNL